MDQNTFYFVTSNKGKILQLNDHLKPYGFTVVQKNLSIGEVQESSVEKIVTAKALAAFEIAKHPLIVEDGGFFIEGLHGFPGAYAKFANETIGVEGILALTHDLEDRRCKFVGALVYIDADHKINVFTDNNFEGTLATKADPITSEVPWSALWSVFIPAGHTKTLAAMTDEERDALWKERQPYSTFEQFAQWIVKEREMKKEQALPPDTLPQERPSWDMYFMGLMEEVAKRATCNRGRSGCVIVKDKQMLCTGYVGSPPGMPHCDDVGHLMRQTINEDGTISQHCVRTVHAEQNAICQAAKHGISLQGTTLYCKMEPCKVCATLIVSVGIKKVIAKKRYHAAQLTRELFLKTGVELVVLEDEVEDYTS